MITIGKTILSNLAGARVRIVILALFPLLVILTGLYLFVIPGYSSSLRYYPDHGITIAFQINTDIGIVDNTTPVVSEMEAGLAEIVISANNSLYRKALNDIR